MLCGYPPFEGDNNKEIFKRVLQQNLEFDPNEWSEISDEVKDLLEQMLVKDPKKRISAVDAMNHRWFEISHKDKHNFDKKIFNKLKDFRAP
jgi:calcium-dependent protein kinase